MFQQIDYLIYSPHKTATQTVKASIKQLGYKVSHIHSSYNFKCKDFSVNKEENWLIGKEESLKNFLTQIKPKIIYILRDPISRLKSSYFQSYHDDLINFLNYNEKETIVAKNNIDYLFDDFLKKVKNDSLPGRIDSIYEIEKITGVTVFEDLIKKNNFFKLEKSYLEIYVIDFATLVTEKEKYLSSCLNINVPKLVETNLTLKKSYKEKYEEFKKRVLGEEVETTIKKRYKKVRELIKNLNYHS